MKTKEQRINDYWKELIMLGSNERFQYILNNLEKFDVDCQVDVFREGYFLSDYGFSQLNESKIKKIYKGFVPELPEEIAGKEIIKIYRGGTEYSTYYTSAFSWTLDFKIAEWFANREKRKSFRRYVVSADIAVKHILDYSNERQEQEFLILPSKLKNITLMPFEEKDTEFPY